MRLLAAFAVVAVVLLGAGCASLGDLVATLAGEEEQPQDTDTGGAADTSAPAAKDEPEPEDEAAAAQALAYQFDAFYGGLWSLGWF